MNTLHKLFYPGSILIAGASSKKGSIGYELTATILKYGYKGKLLLVNPSADEILGIKCFKTINEIRAEIDLAIILVPKQFTEETIENCIAKGIKSYILITAGFKETGAQGELVEKRIAAKIKAAGGRMVGPNCMGLINTLDDVKLNATFVAEHPETGKTGFLSQSGALGAAVLNSLRETGIRFAHFISVGNKADISENDVVEYWMNDENIHALTLYLESFSDGRKFLDIVNTKRNRKPVIILKAGKTTEGMRAASSHTGALGSSDRSVNAVIDQFGLIRADNLNDLFNTAKGFEYFPLPAGNRTAVVTNAGGPAILAVDMLGKCGLELAKFSENIKTELKSIVHPEGSINNPVDLLPGGNPESYKKVIELLVKDEGVDNVIAIFVEPVMVKPIAVIEAINSIQSSKPVFPVFMPLPEFRDDYKKRYPAGKPVFWNPEDPSIVIRNMLIYSNRTNEKRLKGNEQVKKIQFTAGDGFLSQRDVIRLAEQYSLPLLNSEILRPHELKNIKTEFPVVLKAAGEGIVHKTELKGVELNIKSQQELLKAAEVMSCNFKEQGIEIEYYIVQPFIKTRFEILLGGFNDPDFGPMVMFGTGGKYVEYYNDVSIRSAMLSDKDVDEMINNTVMGKLLKGVRGEAAADLCGIKTALLSLAQMMLDYKEVSEVDLNPVIITEDNQLFAVDIRIKVK